MVVKAGSLGSICLFWKDTYISSIAVFDATHQETFERYKEYYKTSLVDALRTRKLKDIIQFCFLGCNTYRSRKNENKKMDRDDHVSFQMVLFFLIILKIVEVEDVCYFAPRKKLSK
jgi:hypothetical protein